MADYANGRQSFEIVNIDLRIVYRVGLSDDDARAAVYNIASPTEVIRAISGQMLARYFARYTIDDVLGQNREVFTSGFPKRIAATPDRPFHRTGSHRCGGRGDPSTRRCRDRLSGGSRPLR